jgi:arsenate reductase (thioredoxin)
MAEALFGRATDGRHEVRSAGSRPAERVHPEVVEAMQELGVDLSGRTPRGLDGADAEWADVVVTMGCGDECPFIPGRRYVDWDLEDPAGRPVEEVRRIRDEIARRVDALLAELGGPTGGVAESLAPKSKPGTSEFPAETPTERTSHPPPRIE